MGSLQFVLPDRDEIWPAALECAYLVGSDGLPWDTRVERLGNRLVASRATRESGSLTTPWPVPGFGALALSTATLQPREAPYHLALELARGALSRLLSQLDASELRVEEIRQSLRAAEGHFIDSSLQQSDLDRCAREAEASLVASLECMQRRARRQFRERREAASFSSRLFGLETHGLEELRQLRTLRRFPGNALLLNETWHDCERNPGERDVARWEECFRLARGARRRTVAGPLLDLHRHALPDWLPLWADDVDAIQTYAAQYVRDIVRAGQGHVHVWYASSATNAGLGLRLSEEQRLRLTLVAIEALRGEDPQTPALVGIQQPWGEYLGRSTLDLSPLQFADIVLRADLGVSGFVLELPLANSAHHAFPRDLVDTQRLLDQWAAFSVPLVLRISLPTQAGLLEPSRLAYLSDLLQLAAARPAVQGILWSQLRDLPGHEAGLFREDGHPKAVLQMLADLDKRARRS
jgi:hypothetical protein